MEINHILGYLLNTSARFIKRRMDKELEKYNITTSQWAVLKLLSSKNGITQMQIAEELKGDRATVGSVIFKLIEKGYADKKLHPRDRRAYLVCITPRAKEIVKEIEEKAKSVTEEALEGLDRSEIVSLYSTLNKVINNLAKGE